MGSEMCIRDSTHTHTHTQSLSLLHTHTHTHTHNSTILAEENRNGKAASRHRPQWWPAQSPATVGSDADRVSDYLPLLIIPSLDPRVYVPCLMGLLQRCIAVHSLFHCFLSPHRSVAFLIGNLLFLVLQRPAWFAGNQQDL